MEKRLFSIFIMFVLAVSIVSPLGLAQVHEVEVDVEIEEAGIGPDSLFYGIDRALERISLALSFDKEKKAARGLRHAEERLSEVQAMIEEGKFEDAERAQEDHDALLEEVEALAVELEDEVEGDKAERVLRKITRHQNRIEAHREKLDQTYTRILDARGEELTDEQLVRLDALFDKLRARADAAELKALEREDIVKVRVKERFNITDDEIEELDVEIEFEEKFEEGRENRALREMERADNALDRLETKFKDEGIIEFDEEISRMRERLELARSEYDAGNWKRAKNIAHEVRKFAERIGVLAFRLHLNDRFNDRLAELRDELHERREDVRAEIDLELENDESRLRLRIKERIRDEMSEYEEEIRVRIEDGDSKETIKEIP